MTAPKLLPCPFCGSEAEMLGGPMAQDCYDVWCKSKQVRHHLRGTMDPVKTAERWNARALATPDQIAALAAKVDASQAPNPAVNGGSCQSDTIPLPRAEVKALMETLAAIDKPLLKIGRWMDMRLAARKALATLQERMK